MKKETTNSVKKGSKLRQKLAVTCVAVYTAVNTGSVVLAATPELTKVPVSQNLQKNEAKKNLDNKSKHEMMQKIMGKRESSSNEFLHVKNGEEDSVKTNMPTKPQRAVAGTQKAVAGLPTYTLGQLRSMSYSDMMNAIAGTTWENISDLFQNTAESRAFYNDSARFQYMLTDLANRGASFNANDDKGIPTIVEVVRSAYFLGFNHANDFPGMWSPEKTKLALPAQRNMLNNPNLKYGTQAQIAVIDALGALIGNTTCDANIANQCVGLLRDFRVNYVEYLKDLSKANAVYKIMSGVGYVYYWESYTHYGEPAQSLPSFGQIDSFIDELLAISELKNLSADDQWLADNGLYYMGQLGKFYSNQNKILQILTNKMDSAQRYSAEFFSAASQINENYNGKNSRGEDINYTQLQKEGNEYWMPKHYTFDDGAIQIQAGDKVSPEKIQRMYWATKEVESQFFRVNGIDKALEPNNADKVLTIRLFNSPAEYKMNSYLNGISTDNGGMYIEPYGTFYTYERTTEESVYSLEELFRHEFTHYLQGKYQVPGMWGDGDFYKNNEIEWFDEGTAEFFAGSTRTEGVQPREAIVNYLSSDPSERFTLSTLFKSGYASGWAFYNYGWAYISYIYNNDISKMIELNDAIVNKNITSFRNILSSQANSSSTEAGYQAYMQKMKNTSNIGTPLVSDAYTQTHEKRSLSQIKNDIMNVTGINNFTEDKTTSPNFSTFKLEGTYTGSTSQGKIADWKAMNEKANGMLKALSNKGWTGYDTVTCYFTNYKVVNGAYQFNIVFRGLLNDGSVIVNPSNQSPVAVIDGKSSAKVNESISFSADRSTDSDGNVVSYSWNFGDGSGSTSANPTHAYATEGTYTVTLKVTDDKGAVGQRTMTVTVTNGDVVVPPVDPVDPVKPGTALSQEIEANDTFDEADKNGFLGNNVQLNGRISDAGDMDFYAFEVEKSGEVNIKVSGANSNVSWVVYKATDTSSYVCWTQNTESNATTGKFDATPGKYYIQVYPISSNISNQNYGIVMNGIKAYNSGDTDPVQPSDGIVNEQEPNNYVDDVKVAIKNNTKGKGTLTAGDSDIFAFEVDKNGKVDIRVDGVGNNYTWVVFKEGDQNNFVCWSQNSDAQGSTGEFNATQGKYYVMLYSYGNANIDYTVSINGIK